MNAFDAYKLFLSLKQHFTTDNYNYFQYLGNVKASVESFQNNKNKYSFYRLVRKYNDIEGFFLANFVYGNITWIGDCMSEEADNNYKRWLKINNAITKIFKDDVVYILDHTKDAFEVINGHNPPLLRAAYQNLVSIETVLILDQIKPFINEWNEQISEPIMWPTFYKKLIKYRPWIEKLDISKFKTIAMEIYNEKTEG